MSGKIFISYRRGGPWSTRSLYDRLAARFDRKQIFMDLESIGAGDDFYKEIEERLDECDVPITWGARELGRGLQQ